jgi:hypothetical protein
MTFLSVVSVKLKEINTDLPSKIFCHNSKYKCPFSDEGEQDVLLLMQVGDFHSEMDQKMFQLMGVDKGELLRRSFSELQKANPDVAYFQHSRDLRYIVPRTYLKSSNCPRITVKGEGTTLFGAHKLLAEKLCQEMSTLLNVQVLELGMSAFHTRVLYSLGRRPSIKDLINNPNFWEDEIGNLIKRKPSLEKHRPILKKCMKFYLYGTINGGGKKLINQASTILHDAEARFYIYNNWQVLSDSRADLKLTLGQKNGSRAYLCYEIDRPEPYRVSSSHLCISKYFQSYEVILLSIMAFRIHNLDGRILSLDHDGLKFMLPKNQQYEPIHINDWSLDLLGIEVPLEPKNHFYPMP